MPRLFILSLLVLFSLGVFHAVQVHKCNSYGERYGFPTKYVERQCYGFLTFEDYSQAWRPVAVNEAFDPANW